DVNRRWCGDGDGFETQIILFSLRSHSFQPVGSSINQGGDRQAAKNQENANAMFRNNYEPVSIKEGEGTMIDNMILGAIQAFCQEHVSPKIKLMVPNEANITDYHLMHPNAFVGWVPPSDQLEDVLLQLPEGAKSAIPAMIISMDEGEDNGSDAGINIRITFIVYNPEIYPVDGEITPNYKGYQDLLNLIFICRQQLSSQYLVQNGTTAAQRPFRWGMYHQQPVHYWAGWLTFRATAAVLPYMGERNILEI
ncbi:MAG: hypothetical protein K6T85_17895, partial [Gorillibacterium sp.]|nr:hypothetical protein [Gorillibacterium sp.]